MKVITLYAVALVCVAARVQLLDATQGELHSVLLLASLQYGGSNVAGLLDDCCTQKPREIKSSTLPFALCCGFCSALSYVTSASSTVCAWCIAHPHVASD
jgi:hypothetical protein